MEIFNNISALKDFRGARRTSLTIGNFDGCHLGHHALISSIVNRSRQDGLLATILTFDPHPIETLGIIDKIPRIQSLEGRLKTFKTLGVDCAVVLPFDRTMSQLSAEEFVTSILSDGGGVRFMAVGEDFRFGHKRAGDIELLRKIGDLKDFSVQIIPPVHVLKEIVSSTRVRRCLMEDADLKTVEAILGRPWRFRGRVSDGDKFGRTIGFPTANLEMIKTLIPKHGVYAVRATNFEQNLIDVPAVMNIGVRPTVNGRHLRVEVHILDRNDLDLYGKELEIEPVQYLRQEMKFDGREQLMQQIAKDCGVARQLL